MKKFRWDLIGIFGGVVGVAMGVIAVLRAGGPQSVQIAIAMVLVFGAMGVLLYKLLWQPRFNVRRLQKSGIPARGKILHVQETNVSVNNNPQLKLEIELTNKDGKTYTAHCKTIVSKKSPVFFQPGKEVKVKVDPSNEKNIIIDAF
ncbi:MAG: hypothetical protein KGM98_15055 [Bacteroidota bacterium]|nr:hypothetical protein [Bacteroidota bacterium]